MATIIAVHGTFAHDAEDGAAHDPSVEPQWWQKDSALEKDLRDFVEPADGNLDVVRFSWSGLNSEVGRREAALELDKTLVELEKRNEPYCVIGHSHGGSVVSSALLESGARKRQLPNLKRWITIGTPFIGMRKERFLLTRLSLIRKVILVASLMLFLMFLVYLMATYLAGERMLFGRTFPRIMRVTGVMTVLPAIIIGVLYYVLDARSLISYRPRVVKRTRAFFARRWLSLAHPDDEAIQGLTLLPSAKLSFFDPKFAVSSMTLLSVFALPVLYLFALTSAPTMVGLASWLKTHVYEQNTSPEAVAALKALREELIIARKSEGAAANDDPTVRAAPTKERRQAWRDYRAKREELAKQYPNLEAVERGERFNQRFFFRNGNECEGGELCGGGHDVAVNSGLLLHLVTDELSWALGAADLTDGRNRRVYAMAMPAVFVPLVFGLVALGLMLLIKWIATGFSRLSSQFLNRITNNEVKRAAFGNDTEGEIATGANDHPTWINGSPARLPAALADIITDYSNVAASQSLAKFRRAIGQIASARPEHTADTAISTYFTWKELVHSSYFDVPEFRKLVAQAISRTEGFAPSQRFKSDPDFSRTAKWLSEIEDSPLTEGVEGAPDAADRKSGPPIVASM